MNVGNSDYEKCRYYSTKIVNTKYNVKSSLKLDQEFHNIEGDQFLIYG